LTAIKDVVPRPQEQQPAIGVPLVALAGDEAEGGRRGAGGSHHQPPGVVLPRVGDRLPAVREPAGAAELVPVGRSS